MYISTLYKIFIYLFVYLNYNLNNKPLTFTNMATLYKKSLTILLAILLFCGFSKATEYTVGTGGTYTTLAAAFTAINGGSPSGTVDLAIISDLTISSTLSITVNVANTYVTIYPKTAARTIISGSTAPASLINLSGAKNIKFDGRINGSGASGSLTIENTSSAASSSTINFLNSAQNNTIQYCKVKGNGTLGIINFSTSTSGSGNDNNLISNNEITCSTSRPVSAINSELGNTTRSNSGITIDNNKIYNFINLSSSSYGINIGNYSSDFTITNNSFYETGSASSAAGIYQIINVNSLNGSKFNISNNFIGGNAVNSGGTWTKTGNTNDFYAIKDLFSTSLSTFELLILPLSLSPLVAAHPQLHCLHQLNLTHLSQSLTHRLPTMNDSHD